MRLTRLSPLRFFRRRTWRALRLRVDYNLRTLGGRRPYRALSPEERAACRHEVGLRVVVSSNRMEEGERRADGSLHFPAEQTPFHWLALAASCPRCLAAFEFPGVEPGPRHLTAPVSAPLVKPGGRALVIPVRPVVPPRTPARRSRP